MEGSRKRSVGGHRGAWDHRRCEEEGDEGPTNPYFVFLNFSVAWGFSSSRFNPGGWSGGALGRVKPSLPIRVQNGVQKVRCFLHVLPSIPRVLLEVEGNQQSRRLCCLSVPRGAGPPQAPMPDARWGSHHPQLGFVRSFQGKVPRGSCRYGCSWPWL